MNKRTIYLLLTIITALTFKEAFSMDPEQYQKTCAGIYMVHDYMNLMRKFSNALGRTIERSEKAHSLVNLSETRIEEENTPRVIKLLLDKIMKKTYIINECRSMIKIPNRIVPRIIDLYEKEIIMTRIEPWTERTKRLSEKLSRLVCQYFRKANALQTIYYAYRGCLPDNTLFFPTDETHEIIRTMIDKKIEIKKKLKRELQGDKLLINPDEIRLLESSISTLKKTIQIIAPLAKATLPLELNQG